ncbi:ornithine decarboxylase 1, variant [Capsaspora owczarzaki ATCC 30864]|nr:ornithine decarboxylase 1, variant [Capsaspora owczarzaki ATCC 30864]
MKGGLFADTTTTTATDNFELPPITPIASGTSIPKLLRAHAADSEDHEPFYIIDVGQVARKYDQWVAALPRVDPFYAVKCNGDKTILKLLAKLGTGFDCASKAEMDTVLKMGVPADRIIYAHPCKMASHVKFASQNNVRMMTFDNEHELHKMKELYPNARLVLRVLTDNSRSICNLGLKFGAALARVPHMLQLAKDLELDVVGVSYHVGSGCFDAQAFADAVAVAKTVFNIGAELGFKFNLLDLGGGFPGSDNVNVKFDDIASVLRVALDKHFPAAENKDLHIIAEPGRYFVSASHTLAVSVVAKRTIVLPTTNGETNDANSAANQAAMASASACPAAAAAAAMAAAQGRAADGAPTFMYYVNDGVYGSFNCILFDHAVVAPRVLVSGNLGVVAMDSDSESDSEERAESGFACSIWGPTCDSMDCITKTGRLPELAIGDWLYFEDMGAYTVAASSTFNGFPKPKLMYVNSESHRNLL